MSVGSPGYRTHLFAAHDHLCAYCLSAPATTLDHVVPRSRGGGVWGNVLPVCESCNRAKGSQTIAEWVATLATQQAQSLAAADAR